MTQHAMIENLCFNISASNMKTSCPATVLLWYYMSQVTHTDQAVLQLPVCPLEDSAGPGEGSWAFDPRLLIFLDHLCCSKLIGTYRCRTASTAAHLLTLSPLSMNLMATNSCVSVFLASCTKPKLPWLRSATFVYRVVSRRGSGLAGG